MNMHPEYMKKHSRVRMVGYGAIAVGCIGFVTPVIPGLILWVVGLSLLSTHSPSIRRLVARARASHPQFVDMFVSMETKINELFNLATHRRSLMRIPAGEGTSLSAFLDEPTFPSAGVALVLHGASGTKDSAVTDALSEALRARGYTILCFDAYDGLGESGGEFVTFTVTKYLSDLRAVMEWVAEHMPGTSILLAGHSLGALVALLYAEECPEKVSKLLLFAPTISGSALLTAYAHHEPDMLTAWRETGSRPVSHPLTGEVHSLSYGFVTDISQYDTLRSAQVLRMPVEIYVGTHDTICSEEDCILLRTATGLHAHVTTVQGLSHTPTTHEELYRLTRTITHSIE